MDDFEKELKEGFLQEAEQSLADVEQCFLALEADPNSADNLNRIFRLAHNLKGSSKAVGFEDMGDLTHEFETFILKIKNGDLASSPKVISFLLRCNDFLGKMVATLKGNLAARFEIQIWLDEMRDLAKGGAPVSAPDPAGTTAAAPSIGTVDMSFDATAVETPAAPTSMTKQDETLRVALSKVETLLNFVGEMVILQSVLREQAALTGSTELMKNVTHLSKISKEIQDISMSLRMVPIKPTFQKMQRIVRDSSQELGKDVVINLSGEGAEIDKNILEKINDPLVHLVRNSVDHGIEVSEVRKSLGKPTKGTIHLSAFHEGGRFVIEVKDDGGGLDAEKLTKIAMEKGLIKPDAVLTENEAYNLIFIPGFSTKAQVTDLSGRGVGMDVVKTNIHALGGEIQIVSTKGVGTTFRIMLPLTLAIIEGMIVTVSGQRFVVPMAHVHETLRCEPKQVQSTSNMGEILLLRDENLSLYNLAGFFGLRSDKHTTEMIAMIVRSGGHPFGLLVDDIIGQSQVVVKSLGREFQRYHGVGGITILGDGKPAFILDPPQLFQRTGYKVSYNNRNGVAV